jgi:hypothetical protein
MSAFSKLFGKRKKEFKAQCELSRQPLDKNSSYLVSTAEIISSRKFWDNKMTEPDTMSYTEAHFKSQDQTAGNIRKMIFEKFSKEDKPWIIADSQLHLFEIDEQTSKEMANQWWDSQGSFIPNGTNNSLEVMGKEKFEEIRTYAVDEAGRKMVAVG